MATPKARAGTANRDSYSHGEVAGYLHDRYHCRRLELAVGLLAGHLESAPGRPGPVVVDLGAGDGSACGRLADHGLRPIAGDIVPDAARAVRARGITAIALDAGECLPFRSGSLDGILAGEIIEHLFDPGLLLRECGRVLRRGGMLVVTTPNLAPAQDRLRFLAGRAPRQVDPFHEYLYLHIRPFTYSLLAYGLRRAGLTPIRLLSNYAVWRTRFGEIRCRWIADRWPTLGGSLIVAAVRPSGAAQPAPGTEPAWNQSARR